MGSGRRTSPELAVSTVQARAYVHGRSSGSFILICRRLQTADCRLQSAHVARACLVGAGLAVVITSRMDMGYCNFSYGWKCPVE